MVDFCAMEPTRARASYLVGGIVALALTLTPVASAESIWSDPGFHWRAKAPFTVNVVSKLTSSDFQSYLVASSADWSQSSAVDVAVTSKGRVDVYEGDYGRGTYVAWTYFTLNNGYVQHAYVYLNTSYRGLVSDFVWQLAVCQELGHALGLGDHRLDYPALPSCMAPYNYGTSPNAEDLQQLELIYGGSSTGTSPGKGPGKDSGATPTTTSDTKTSDTTTSDSGTISVNTAPGKSGERGSGNGGGKGASK